MVFHLSNYDVVGELVSQGVGAIISQDNIPAEVWSMRWVHICMGSSLCMRVDGHVHAGKLVMYR